MSMINTLNAMSSASAHMAATSPSSSGRYKRDDTYYCTELVLAVEDTLFRVPRAIFEQSEAFRDMFSIPQFASGVVEGSDDEHPLVLEGHLAQDFKQLLRVLLPLQAGMPVPLNSDEWMSVLKLASVWGFHVVKDVALQKLAPMALDDPILKIIIAKKYDVPAWFIPGVNALAQRKDPLTFADACRFKELGSSDFVLDFSLKISSIRDYMSADPPAPAPFDRRHNDFWGEPIRHSDSPFGNEFQQRAGDGSSRDFTVHICDIFECNTKGEPSVGGVSVEEILNVNARSTREHGRGGRRGTGRDRGRGT